MVLVGLVAGGPLSAEPADIDWVEIPAGEFAMGAGPSDPYARADEKPQHQVKLDAFQMSATEITNAQFRAFVDATGYQTQAEKPVDWEELKKQVPPGTPKPPAEMLQPGSLVFMAEPNQVGWAWVRGADWRHPTGPGSDIEGKDDHPVVQVSWDDAVAYAKWAGGRLPTEAEWEYASRGGQPEQTFYWGEESPDAGETKANTWTGQFPVENTAADGFERTAPVKQFKPNGYGLYDMAGNAWEWTADWYRPDTYRTADALSTNPTGPDDSFDPDEPTAQKRVTRGGSFLCHVSYCASYRNAARMKSTPDTGLNHTGFRVVREAKSDDEQ